MNDSVDNLATRLFGRIPSSLLLTAAFSLLLLSTVLISSYLLVSSGREIVNDVIAAAARTASREAHSEIERFLATPQAIGKLINTAVEEGYVSPESHQDLARLFWNIPQRDSPYPISAIYFTTSTGTFTGIGTHRREQPPIWVHYQGSKSTDDYADSHHLGKDGSIGERIDDAIKYEATARPWYLEAVKADTPIWTNFYSDADSDEPVITWAGVSRYRDASLAGVFGIDVFLKRLINFLVALPVSTNTAVFLVTPEGKVISDNGTGLATPSTETGVDELPYINRLIPAALALLDVQQDSDEGALGTISQHVTLVGESGFLQLSPIKQDIGLDWSIGVFVPESDYLTSIESHALKVVPLILLALLIAGVSLYGFLHLVARPLTQLRRSANQFAAGNFAAPIDTSCTNEVGELASAIDSMRHNLRDAFSNLTTQKVKAETTLAAIADGVITVNDHGHVTYLNPSAEQQVGLSSADAEGQKLEDVFKASSSDLYHEVLRSGSANEGVSREEALDYQMSLQSPSGDSRRVECRVRAIQDTEAKSGAVIVFSDVTEQFRLQANLKHQATHDGLTGLVNRREFDKRLQHTIEHVKTDATKHVLCFMDIDQFKVVNDTCGHVAGDSLLRQIAVLIKKHIPDDDTCARLGGDEFGLILHNCNIERAERITDNILEALADFRFVWEQRVFSVGISVGVVAIHSTAGGDVNSLLRDADSACYSAKEAGRNRVHIYRADNEELASRRREMQWVDKIDRALEHDQFVLYAQTIEPAQYNDRSAPPRHHFEVLLRMLDHSGSVISPGVFLPAAERFNLANEIDRWVITHTLACLSAHPEVIPSLELCSINLSGHSLGDAEFLPFIVDALERSALPMNCICFEVTETATIANIKSALTFINTLKKLGCQFALDDFGSGLSSFGYLKTLPVDYLKIDGVFVSDILRNPIDLAMVRSINDIGQLMGVKTIAEFVENKETEYKLQELGIDYVQGYHIAKPQPLEHALSSVHRPLPAYDAAGDSVLSP